MSESDKTAPVAAADLTRVAEALEALSAQVAQLSERVQTLEAQHGHAAGPAGNGHPPVQDVLDTDTVSVIAAAVAAYLGEGPRIRSIRLLSGRAWAQQGRATIQASYAVSAPAHSTPTR